MEDNKRFNITRNNFADVLRVSYECKNKECKNKKVNMQRNIIQEAEEWRSKQYGYIEWCMMKYYHEKKSTGKWEEEKEESYMKEVKMNTTRRGLQDWDFRTEVSGKTKQ